MQTQQTPAPPPPNARGPFDWPEVTTQAQQTPAPAPPAPPAQTWAPLQEAPTQRLASRNQYHEAGIPIWGLLLIAIGLVALFGQWGLDTGWIFGLALGAWFVYLGVRPANKGEAVNWWLAGIGLLIGLGSISTAVTEAFVFPGVLILVGVGILAERAVHRPNP